MLEKKDLKTIKNIMDSSIKTAMDSNTKTTKGIIDSSIKTIKNIMDDNFDNFAVIVKDGFNDQDKKFEQATKERKTLRRDLEEIKLKFAYTAWQIDLEEIKKRLVKVEKKVGVKK